MVFVEDLLEVQLKKNTLLCVGLDSDVELIPERFSKFRESQFEFNKWIVSETCSDVSVYKLNLAFYEVRGAMGWKDLELTMRYLQKNHPKILTIADAKRGDIGSTSEAYARALYDELGFDAVTVSPYLGKDALKPFLRWEDKGVIVLCRTSNLGAGEFQDLKVLEKSQVTSNKLQTNHKSQITNAQVLWEYVARQVSEEWNEKGNCMLVVGATYPDELRRVREIVGEMPLLVPGVGKQGGDLEEVIRVGLNQRGVGVVINSSRGIIFSNDVGKKARELRQEINRYRSMYE